MQRKGKLAKFILLVLHKFNRYTPQQRAFIVYFLVLSFCLLFFPLLRVAPVGSRLDEVSSSVSYSVYLFGGGLFKIMLIILISMSILLAWNMSFRFKNIVISYLGFKENDALFNFGFLWIITTAFLSIGDTMSVVNEITASIQVTTMYYIIEVVLVGGLILTLVSVIKKAQTTTKNKIIHIVDEQPTKEVETHKKLTGLFSKDE